MVIYSVQKWCSDFASCELFVLGDVTQSEDSFFDLDDATSPSSHSFSNQLNGKGTGESNSLFTEMSRLALMAMTKEQENKQLMERIQFLESTAREKEDHKIAKVVNVRSIFILNIIMCWNSFSDYSNLGTRLFLSPKLFSFLFLF